MKKIVPIFFILTFLVEGTSYCQKIDKVEIDKFTGQKRILTKKIILYEVFTKGLYIYIRTVDSTVFIRFYGNVGVGVVGPLDATTFLFSDKTTSDVLPTSLQSYDTDPQGFSQQYYFSKSQLQLLAEKNIISVRRTYNDTYIDIDVKEKHANKIKELAKLVLNELSK